MTAPRPVRLTLAQVALLLDLLTLDGLEAPTLKMHRAVRAKLEASTVPAAPGVDPRALEAALLESARGRVVALPSGASGYSRAAATARNVHATVEDARVVGAWLGRQGWMRGTMTVLGVLNKWDDWLGRARAEAPPTRAEEGYGGTTDTPNGPARPGPGGRGRGKAEGFG